MTASILPLKAKIASALINWLKRDGLVWLLYLLATIIMTYPVAFKLGGDWVASRDVDTYVKLWDQWWFGKTISAGLPVNFTRDLFFPLGLDLTFHSISWTVTVLIWLMTPILNPIGAYNFSILVAVFTTAYGGYLLIRSMTDHQAAAWIGGAVYSFIPYHMAHTGGHPDLVHLSGIPIAALLLVRALSKSSLWAAVGTAVMLGLTALTSLYIMDFALITLIPLFIYCALQRRRWQQKDFWKVTMLCGLASSLALSPRLIPIFESPSALSAAIEAKYDAASLQTDLLAFVTPSHFNPIFAPYVSDIAARFNMNHKWPAYLGIVAILMGLSALTWKKQRGLIWTWAALGVLFGIMALGPVLRLNGQVYDNITLPATYLAGLPPIRAVGRPDYFVLGLILPLSVGAGFGADRWLTALGNRRRAKFLFTIGIGAFLLFEYWNGVYPGFTASVSPFYAQLAQEPGQFAVIDLPLGRDNSKEYMYLQTTHHRPLVEGLSARTPPEAYQYIDANPLLSRWRSDLPLHCSEMSGDAIKQSVQQLAAAGFKYVILHRQPNGMPTEFAGYLTSKPIYKDAGIKVYAIADLQANPPCASAP